MYPPSGVSMRGTGVISTYLASQDPADALNGEVDFASSRNSASFTGQQRYCTRGFFV